MSDRRLHFLISVGELCVAAKLGDFRVEVLTTAGARIAGVPAPVPDEAESELDETDYSQALRLDGALVNLDQILTLTIHAPQESPN